MRRDGEPELRRSNRGELLPIPCAIRRPKHAIVVLHPEHIGRDGPAYVPRAKMTPQEGVGLILRHGGLPVLAHPARELLDLEEVLPSLKEAGLVGMEVHYKDYTPDEIRRLQLLCDEYDLVPCGGSDYHALGTPDQVEPGIVGPPLESLQRLVALAGSRGAAVARALV